MLSEAAGWDLGPSGEVGFRQKDSLCGVPSGYLAPGPSPDAKGRHPLPSSYYCLLLPSTFLLIIFMFSKGSLKCWAE